MGDDCIPKDDGEKVGWLSNYRDNITAVGRDLGLGPDETTAIREEIDAFLVAHGNHSRLRKSLHAAAICLRDLERGLMEKLRLQIARVKSAAGCPAGIARRLRIEEEAASFDWDAFKPTFNLMAEAGCVRVDFVKGGADAVNIYSRIRGQAAWRFVARDTNSPYMDCSTTSGTESAEIREYMLRGVLNDEEIGRASDVVTVSCGESIRSVGPGPTRRVGRWA
jgi:hypothetical protein